MTSDPLTAIRGRRPKTRAVAWVCPELQAERMAAMLAEYDAADLEALRASYAVALTCPICSPLLTVAAIHHHLDAGGEVCEHLEATAILRRREQEATRARLAAQLAVIEGQRAEAGPGLGDVHRRASAYLAAIPGGVSGQGRSAGAWRVALALVRGWALSEDAALDLMAREYGPRCSPAWASRELLGMVRRAGRATQVGHGWLLVGRENRRGG